VSGIHGKRGTPEGSGAERGPWQDQAMTLSTEQLSPDDWRRICDALRYLGRDLHHRSFSVTAERRELLWEEMDQCLALADRLSDALRDQQSPEASVD
jgi:hypothetical protein